MAIKTVAAPLLLLLCLSAASCNKKTGGSGATYKGVIIKNLCCQAVVQTLGPNYLGQNNWPDSNTADLHIYNHVFKVANPCQFGNHQAGDTITFKVIAQQPQNCACCMLYVATPTTSYPIEVL